MSVWRYVCVWGCVFFFFFARVSVLCLCLLTSVSGSLLSLCIRLHTLSLSLSLTLPTLPPSLPLSLFPFTLWRFLIYRKCHTLGLQQQRSLRLILPCAPLYQRPIRCQSILPLSTRQHMQITLSNRTPTPHIYAYIYVHIHTYVSQSGEQTVLS